MPRSSLLPSRRGLLLRIAAALLVLIATSEVALVAWWLPDPSPSVRSRGTNALWLRHGWVGDAHSDTDYGRLARLLVAGQISDAFFHVGPLDGDGLVPSARYTHAAELTRAMHRMAPGVRLQAYLGQISIAGGGPLDLRVPAVREQIVRTAGAFLDLGFDGIHYDIEPLSPPDAGFLGLLGRTHDETSSRGAVLSVSIPKLEAVDGGQAVDAVLSGIGRALPLAPPSFIEQVAARVDQVAVMVYDTPLPTAPPIGRVYAWETEQVLRLIGDHVTVFIGVPSYEEGPHLTGEDMSTAIRGARRGIDALTRPPARPYGLAVFAEWTTSNREWAIWRHQWLEGGSGA